ncbi:type I-E CRISPR-associated protein Cas5/CasD [Streptomyces phytophilus]|uniref:type I-E CRISPR-associated protein Cas5/CasD n=1 Tax=Streptomyces phytophilus TaxID=722715 RepID=UPI0015F0DBD4|nr:type I-E CRISPR-associated protein Cas5/CasD [Streptomyces phytophilus]
MSGLLLRLAGPLQSWGERSVFTHRDTTAFPTRSALTGMFAAAEGRDRTQDPAYYADLRFTVRVDRPGLPLTDYHTVGGGLPPRETLITSEGKHKGAAVVSHRQYLADAVFTVAVTGPDASVMRIAEALEHPIWAPFLGRRACVPDEPLLLAAGLTDPEQELLTSVPLSPDEARRATGDTVHVTFLWDRTPPHRPETATALDVADQPLSFHPHNRRYGLRRLYRTEEPLPATLTAPRGELRSRLLDYCLGALA